MNGARALLAGRVPAVANKGCRMACRNCLLLVAAALVGTAAASAAVAGDAGEYTFTVLKDGSPVGQHRVAFEREGDRIEIREDTAIEVRFALIPLYTFEHEGRQVWEDGRAVRIDATTNDNGEKFDITVRANRDGYIRTVNGRVDRFDRSTAVLAFWNMDTLRHNAFFSAVEDKTLDAAFQYVGQEKFTIAGEALDVEHYRMTGDEERELWYDAAGHIAKVELRRHGSEIAYVRDQTAPRVPSSRCTKFC
jgi:Family of unknown function (DUF6134)